VLKILGAALFMLVLAAGAFYAWASLTTGRRLGRTFATHSVDFPIPFPVTEEEVRRQRLTPEAAQQIASQRALERGKHLVESRYACGGCHGGDFSGGVMVDAAPIGRLLGPNLTRGKGGRTLQYAPADWDRIVRHGIRPDGRPAAMPSEDFQRMTDQELSDIIVFLGAQPPVDNEVPPVALGPLGKILLATGRLPLSADLIESHDTPHAVSPPEPGATAEFGQHLAGVCRGCHRADLAGGPIVGGDPGWPPASNLTPHASGLAGWTYQQFVVSMREGRRPDGTPLRVPMIEVLPYAQEMTEVELEALWTYLQSVPPVPSRD
jgi:cytochrome c5